MMKKKLLKSLFIAVMACMATSSALAQGAFSHHAPETDKAPTHEGRFFTGGAVSFWSGTKDKTLTLDLAPEIGYLFNDRWGVGMVLGYEYEQKGKGAAKVTSNAFNLAPFVRYYYCDKKPFKLYLDGGVGFNFVKEKAGGVSEDLSGFEIGLRPGACVDLTEGLCLCLRMGFVGYRNDYFMGEEPKMGSRGFGFRFAPEELMIGLELEF